MARDDAEYVEFVAAVQDGLRRTAYLLTGDWGLAGCATREALTRLYVAWPRLEPGAGLAAYARRVVVVRTVGRQPHHARPAVPADESTLMAALRRLPPQQRGCVVLRCFEELSVSETAEALRCSEGQVADRTARGIGTIRHELARRGMPSMSAAAMEGVA